MTTVYGQLRDSRLSELIETSNLIVFGRVVKSEQLPDGDGVAKIEIREIYKGVYHEEYLKVGWSSEIHDQAAKCTDTHLVFFLSKSTDGIFRGAQYGRSFWPLRVNMDTQRLIVPYKGPLKTVELDIPGLLTTGSIEDAELGERGGLVYVPAIPLERLSTAVRGIGSGKKK